MKPKKTRNSKRWTEARWRSFVISALRAAFRKWPPKSEVLKSAKVGMVMSTKLKRLVNNYQCAICNNTFTSTHMQVDHIEPVVNPKKGWVSWTQFIERLFCEADSLQAVCKDCHQKKTERERMERNEQRRSAKAQ